MGRGAACTFAPRQDERAAPILGRTVDLFPETHEVVDRRDRGHQHGEVAGRNCRPSHRNDEPAAEVPLEPAMGEDGRDYKDDLDHSLELAYVAGLDGESLGGGNGAKSGD